MNKKEYLDELKKELKLNNISEIDDILSEYEEHFKFKLEEGLTEEEISKKLSSPKEIAKEYISNNVSINKFEKGVKATGITFLSIPLSMIYILMWCAVVALGAFSVATLGLGFCLTATINIASLIPYIPYMSSLIVGLASLGLSLLSAIGTIYMFVYVKFCGSIYIKWCKNIVNGTHYLVVSKNPNFSKKVSSKLKLLAMIGLIVFGVMLLLGYFTMSLQANSLEFWHVWNWFN